MRRALGLLAVGCGGSVVSATDAGPGDAPFDAQVCPAAPTPTVLATGAGIGGEVMAVDATDIYWASVDSVRSLPRCGGVMKTIAANEDFPLDTVLAGGFVHWTTPSAVRRAPVGGGPTSTLASFTASPFGYAVDSQQLFVALRDIDDVETIPLAGGSATSFTKGRHPLAVDDRDLYVHRERYDSAMGWIGEIVRVSKSTKAETMLATMGGDFNGFDVQSMALDETHVYFSGRDGDRGYIRRVPKAGGTMETLASNLPAPGPIAVDALHVYWTNYGTMTIAGGVARVAKQGGSIETLATTTRPEAMTIDATSIYWIEIDGAVMKLDKP